MSQQVENPAVREEEVVVVEEGIEETIEGETTLSEEEENVE